MNAAFENHKKRLTLVGSLIAIALLVGSYLLYYYFGVSGNEKSAAYSSIYLIDSFSSQEISDEANERINSSLATAHSAARTRKDKKIANDLDELALWSELGRPIHSATGSLAAPIGSLDKNDPRRPAMMQQLYESQKSDNDLDANAGRNRETAAKERASLMKELE